MLEYRWVLIPILLIAQCIKDDELVSSAFGIDTGRMKSMAFTYGCFLAGVAGALYAHLYTFLHPSNFDFLRSIDFLIIVIVGGMGSITGTAFAGLVWIGFIEGLRIGQTTRNRRASRKNFIPCRSSCRRCRWV